MIWFVHRRENGEIASAHAERQEGYAEEAIEESHPDFAAYKASWGEPQEGGAE